MCIRDRYSSTVLGVDGVEVEVEVDFRPMAEKRTFIVGLPDAAVKEDVYKRQGIHNRTSRYGRAEV